MAKATKSLLQKYCDPRANCNVLSCLMKNPRLLNSKDRPLDDTYFDTNKTHRALFLVIENLHQYGIESIKLGDIETYLSTHDQLTYKRFFEIGDESEWILELLDLDVDEFNYEHYYNIVAKFAYLRAKIQMGQDVTDILDMNEIDNRVLEEQYSNFMAMPLSEIIKHYDMKNLEVKSKFMHRKAEDSRKSGDEAEKLFESFKLAPSTGWKHADGTILDEISRGARRGMLTIQSRESGLGKTRSAIKQCCMLSCDTLWDYKTKSFQPNPFGEIVPTLYMGTEMKLYEEIEPIIWAVISGVEEDKIRMRKMSTSEEERVLQAIEIAKRAKIFLENEPDYTCSFIEYTIDKYVTQHNIGALVFDYIELIPTLTAEYVRLTRGVTAREDMVLLHLSTQLKNFANDYNIYIHAYTQISNDARRDDTIRDSGAIKGSKSLQVRADLGIVTMRPTVKELEKIKPLSELKGEPNICYNVYKNRGGTYVEVKIWAYINLGNMHQEELFVTKWDYRHLPNLKGVDLKAYKEDDIIFDDNTGEIIEPTKKVGRRR